MKRKSLIITALTLMICFCGQLNQKSYAAPVWNMPTYVIQPNGDTLHCFVTGDEYYQRLHDANNYTIVQNPTTGYYMYAIMHNGQLTASNYIAGKSDPTAIGMEPGLTISQPEILARHKRFDIPERYQTKTTKAHSNHGILNNLVIFVRFADDDEISTPFSYINSMYNDSTAGAVSVYNYYQSATYKQLRILTHYYPIPEGDQIFSYQDIHPRNYYRPQTPNNPDGYPDSDEERKNREFDLLERATRYIDSLGLVPEDLMIDEDNNGEIDNISYVVKGGVGGWSELLWPHKWNMYDRDVYLRGKKINTFNFILEGAGSHYFGTSTLCHEMFHALGAPDLYHYYNYTNVHPTGGWDLMEQNANPPQHMGAYMKFKYGKWIDSIPIIREQGTYKLRPVAHPSNSNNCYRILSNDENQYYVLEYRDQAQPFESGLPGTGLLIYRINTLYNGNAEFDKESYFDEVYVFRPDGNDSVSGQVEDAYFTPTENRTQFDYTTNPQPTLTHNIVDTSFSIRNIHFEGDSLIVFDYIKNTGCRMPVNAYTRNITGRTAELTWEGYTEQYMVEYGRANEEALNTLVIDSNHVVINNLEKNTDYRWRVKGICPATGDIEADSSNFSEWIIFETMPCYNTIDAEIGKGNSREYTVPINTNFNYSYTQQIYTASEMGNEPISISKISFNYATKNQLIEKFDCKIYLGNIARHDFEVINDFVPIDSMQLVYEGPLNCIKGWNSILLNNTFEYDGEHNIVIAIDDNSNNKNNSAKFVTTNTTEYFTISAYSSSNDPNPENMTEFVGIKSRKHHRSNIRFEGCDPNGDDVKINVAEDCNVTICTSHLSIQLTGDKEHTYSIYDITGRLINQSQNKTSCTINVPQGGVYLVRIDNSVTKKVVVF